MLPFDLTPFSLLLIGVANLVGETFGTIFGGGSFVTQPAMLVAGIPASVAVANDVAAAAFASLNLLSPVLLAVMIPISILAGVLAGRLTAMLGERTLRGIYAVVIAGLMVALLLKAV